MKSNSYLAAAVAGREPSGKTTKHGKQTAPVMLVARAKSAAGAAILVNEYSNQLGAYLVNLAAQHQSQKAGSSGTPTAESIGYQVVTPAVPKLAHKSSKKSSVIASRKIRVLVGLGAGLLIAALIVLARELFDKRIRSGERAESTFGYPVVAEIPGRPHERSEPSLDLDVVADPGSVASEAYRMLRMSVLFEALAKRTGPSNNMDLLLGGALAQATNGNGSKGPATGMPGPGSPPSEGSSPSESIGSRQVVLVVSAGPEPTRPQVAANFAAVHAEAGQRAVVISTAELGSGRQAVPTGRLTGEIRPEDVEARLEPSRIEHVFRLPLGDFVDNSGQLVTRAPAVIEATRSIADVIVVEAPPLLAVHHAEALSHAVDVVLVVGECWFTTFDDARRAGELLRRMEAPVLGLVLTNVKLSRRDIRQVHAAAQAMAAPGAELPVDPTEQVTAEYSPAGVTHPQS